MQKVMHAQKLRLLLPPAGNHTRKAITSSMLFRTAGRACRRRNCGAHCHERPKLGPGTPLASPIFDPIGLRQALTRKVPDTIAAGTPAVQIATQSSVSYPPVASMRRLRQVEACASTDFSSRHMPRFARRVTATSTHSFDTDPYTSVSPGPSLQWALPRHCSGSKIRKAGRARFRSQGVYGLPRHLRQDTRGVRSAPPPSPRYKGCGRAPSGCARPRTTCLPSRVMCISTPSFRNGGSANSLTGLFS